MSSQKFLNQTTHNISWFAKRHQAGELQIKAPFQRNPVWSDRQKSYLIDTILNGYPVPELYIQEFTDAQGNDRYVVVDGQQRLRACFEFISGEFAMHPEDSPDYADMKFADLSEEQKKTIYGYNFVIRVLPEMDDAMLRAMFQRINRNTVALNRQELRHATFWGEFMQSVEQLSDLSPWASLGVFSQNDIRRMLDVEFVSELAIAMLHGLQNKKEDLDEWYRAYEKEFPQRRDMEATFQKILSEISSILPDCEQTRWKKKSDFYSLFIALYHHSARIPFARDERQRVRERLILFSTEVDKVISEPETEASAGVKKYLMAVERAASDIGNRKDRQGVLNEILSSAIDETPVGQTRPLGVGVVQMPAFVTPSAPGAS